MGVKDFRVLKILSVKHSPHCILKLLMLYIKHVFIYILFGGVFLCESVTEDSMFSSALFLYSFCLGLVMRLAIHVY